MPKINIAFKEWKTEHYYDIQLDTNSRNPSSFENSLEWIEKAWQAASLILSGYVRKED